jgi:hypothetical protein
MKKKTIKLGRIVGSKLYLAEGQDIPVNCSYKMAGNVMVCFSCYQNRYNVPQSFAIRNGIERISG